MRTLEAAGSALSGGRCVAVAGLQSHHTSYWVHQHQHLQGSVGMTAPWPRPLTTPPPRPCGGEGGEGAVSGQGTAGRPTRLLSSPGASVVSATAAATAS